MPGQLSLFKSKRQRGVKAPAAPEYNTHVMVADTLRRWQTPGWRWSHFPAGEWRHPSTAMRLKRMGVQVGWPDFILLAPEGGAHFLELKKQGKTLTDWQRAFAIWCAVNGYPYAFHDNYKDAIDTLKVWGALRVRVAA
jgi:hypothetical protein